LERPGPRWHSSHPCGSPLANLKRARNKRKATPVRLKRSRTPAKPVVDLCQGNGHNAAIAKWNLTFRGGGAGLSDNRSNPPASRSLVPARVENRREAIGTCGDRACIPGSALLSAVIEMSSFFAELCPGRSETATARLSARRRPEATSIGIRFEGDDEKDFSRSEG